MNNDLFKAAQIRALRAVENPTFEDTFKRIQRWYSTTYHVDITKIDTVPDEEILQAWFEERFRALKDSPDEKIQEEWTVLKRSILFEKEVQTVEDEDAEWERQMIEEIKAQNAIQEPEKPKESPNLISDTPDQMELSGTDDFYVPED